MRQQHERLTLTGTRDACQLSSRLRSLAGLAAAFSSKANAEHVAGAAPLRRNVACRQARLHVSPRGEAP